MVLGAPASDCQLAKSSGKRALSEAAPPVPAVQAANASGSCSAVSLHRLVLALSRPRPELPAAASALTVSLLNRARIFRVL